MEQITRAGIDLFEAMYTARALRRFKPDPVPDEIITRLLDAAIRGPSGSNNQNWLFVVIKDAQQRLKIGELYRKAGELLQTIYKYRERPAHMSEEQQARLFTAATHLMEHLHEAPVLICACLRAIPMKAPAGETMPPTLDALAKAQPRTSGSSIYPAVQNIILACRALGLGTVLTTIHTFVEDEIKAVLGLPPEVTTYALLPIGYPRGKYGPLRRLPVSQVACLDRWGTPWPGGGRDA